MGFIINFYTIFGTNLLTGGPVQIAVFLPNSVLRSLRESRFGTNAIQETWSGRQGSNKASTSQGGVPRG